MKRMTNIILLTFSILFFGNFTFSQTVKETDYKLVIAKGKVVKENKQTFWIIPTTLTDNTKDSLKYFSMSCSWQNFYSVDNSNLEIEVTPCDKNVPTILTLAPSQSKTIEMRLLIRQKIDTSEIKFRIGFNLMKLSKTQKIYDFDFKEEQKKKNVIWSNVISM